MPGAVSGDKWDAILFDACFGWLNRWGWGGGGEWVIRWIGISGKRPECLNFLLVFVLVCISGKMPEFWCNSLYNPRL